MAIKKDEVVEGAKDKVAEVTKKAEKVAKVVKAKAEKAEKAVKAEVVEVTEKAEKAAKVVKAKAVKVEKAVKEEVAEVTEKAEKAAKVVKAKAVKVEKAVKEEVAQVAEKVEKAAKVVKAKVEKKSAINADSESVYAVISACGKQYKVKEGDIVFMEKLPYEEGDEITFDEILAINDGDGPVFGTPVVKGAKVVAKVIKNDKSKKIIVFKFKAKKNYRRKQGHRQAYTKVQITKISK